MMPLVVEQSGSLQTAESRCPVFGICGGCAFQHLSYSDELERKQEWLQKLFRDGWGSSDFLERIVPSPEPYGYRHRLDLTMRKTRDGFMLGFQHPDSRKMIAIESCAIAKPAVSDFIPQLKEKSIAGWLEGYRNANLVVKTGDDGRVLWGGMGRRSLQTSPEHYLWTEIHGKRIFYSLDSFFQANLSILPALMQTIETHADLNHDTLLFDLYAGVGLFGIYFADRVKESVIIEDALTSMVVAEFNARYHQVKNARLIPGRVESELPKVLAESFGSRKVALVDPPRKGLHASAVECLSAARELDQLIYLSCNPETLIRDLKLFQAQGWQLAKAVPFDFFPKTRHIETLAFLSPLKGVRP